MTTTQTSQRVDFVSAPFVTAAIAVALLAGFGIGAALFGALALSLPIGAWWPAAAQVHGHVQLFGWAGLMVFGVGLHFLPRLRGAPLAGRQFVPVALALIVGGLALRTIVQPVAAAIGATQPATAAILTTLLALSGVAELAGATVAIAMLVATGLHGRKRTSGSSVAADRPAFVAVLPLIGCSFAGLWIALALNAVALIAPGSASGLLDPRLDGAIVLIGFLGFLVPVAVAIASRIFPLYLWTPVANPLHLRLELAVLVVGIALRLVGSGNPGGLPNAIGNVLTGVALIGFVLTLGVLHRRGTAPNPRRVTPASERASNALTVPACVWLGVAGVVQVMAGLGRIVPLPVPSADLDRHVLGAGFITLLILGVGLRMLPGFRRQREVSPALAWWAAALGHGAATLRILPVVAIGIAPGVPSTVIWTLLGLAGVLALGAIVAFALAVLGPVRA